MPLHGVRAVQEEMMRIQKVVALLAALSVLALAGTASAQNFSADARKIAMGGNGGDSSNIAAGMMEKRSPYSVIMLPFGLIQIFKDGTDRFDPSSKAFDPVRAVEDATNPLHWTFGRETSSGGQAFVNDIINGKLNSALTTYKGFHIPATLNAEGLMAPDIGGTIKLFKAKGGAFQGVYVGIGPYMAFNTSLTVDQKLVDMLGNGTATACVACPINDASQVQIAWGPTLGYRAKWPIGGKSRDGVYLAYNYHWLNGLEYLNQNIAVKIDTNASGTIVPPTAGNPVVVSGLESTDGTGHASDIGFEVVRGYWEVGFGVNGIGNEITWKTFKNRTFTLSALTTGLDFVETTTPSALGPQTVKVKEVKTGNVGFQAGGWGAVAVVTDGFNGHSFNGGVEHKLGPLWLRGGGRKTRGKWDPTYGFGIGSKVALDFGFYGSHANLEGKRQTSMAVSIRINH
jgi:hypothetical protein